MTAFKLIVASLFFITLSAECAFAENAPCVYAGWPGVLSDDQTMCSNPKLSSLYKKFENHCSKSQISCNPLLFSDGLCADISDTDHRKKAFASCEQQFKDQGGSYDYVKSLSKEKKGYLANVIDIATKVCTSGPQSGSKMCTTLLSKIADLNRVRETTRTAAAPPLKKSSGLLNKAPVEVKQEVKETQVVPPVTTKKEACCMVSRDLNPIPSGVSESKTALEALSYHEQYLAIKKDYLSSEKCHLYSDLSPSNQQAFFVNLYRPEIETFRATQPSEYKTPITDPDLALRNLQADLGWTDARREQFKSTMPASSASEEEKARFQSKLMAEIASRTSDPEFRKRAQPRVKALLDKFGLRDCDPDNNDFFTEEAYVAARKAEKKVSPKDDRFMTIVDRSHSLKKTDRRVTILDRKTGKVLMHTTASFGIGNQGKTLGDEEEPWCSNTGRSLYAPYGAGVTNGTRGMGTHVLTESAKNDGTLVDRQIEFHAATGLDFLSKYYPEGGEPGAGDLLKSSWNSPGKDTVNHFMFRANRFSQPRLGATLGCVGIPPEKLKRLEKTIENGTYVYFYCPADMRK